LCRDSAGHLFCVHRRVRGLEPELCDHSVLASVCVGLSLYGVHVARTDLFRAFAFRRERAGNARRCHRRARLLKSREERLMDGVSGKAPGPYANLPRIAKKTSSRRALAGKMALAPLAAKRMDRALAGLIHARREYRWPPEFAFRLAFVAACGWRWSIMQ